jgi:hypothetical protein
VLYQKVITTSLRHGGAFESCQRLDRGLAWRKVSTFSGSSDKDVQLAYLSDQIGLSKRWISDELDVSRVFSTYERLIDLGTKWNLVASSWKTLIKMLEDANDMAFLEQLKISRRSKNFKTPAGAVVMVRAAL